MADSKTVPVVAVHPDDEVLGCAATVARINTGTAPAICQDMSKRTTYGKIDGDAWPIDKVKRARVFSYA